MKSDYTGVGESDFIPLIRERVFMDPCKLFQEYLHCQRRIDEYYHELAVRLKLSDSAFGVLWTLLELGDGCTQRDICDQFAVSKQTIHSCVRKLTEEGLLSLRPGPGREVRVYPTDAGRALIQEKIVPVKNAEDAVARTMGKEDLADMVRLTRKWLDLFRKEGSSILNS